MQLNQADNHIEFKINRDLGGIISAYFDFLKQNIKKFNNVFLSYNGIFLIGLLIVSYLLVTGFIGLIRAEQSNFTVGSGPDETYIAYFVGGGILFTLIAIILMMLNYSLSGSYLIKYEESANSQFEKKDVWKLVKERIGQVLVFVLLLIPIYFIFAIVYVIVAIIPIVGFFGQIFGQYLMAAWIGVAFFALLKENKGVTSALGEGWNLITKNFWKSIGVNFILGLLNAVLMGVVLMIPGILIGIYSYHVIENGVNVSESIIPTIIYTLGTCILLILWVYSICLRQFVNGILYYTLHEKTYNTHTRAKIDQIGNLD